MKVKSVSFNQISSQKNQKVKNDFKDSCLSKNNIDNKPFSIFPNSKNISFARSWREHTSWGATVNPDTKEVNFKLFTYPDSKKATVTIENQETGASNTLELKNMGQGIFQTEKPVSKDIAGHGDTYFYTIYKGNGEIDRVKDPYSFRQKELMNSSVIYDHSLYQWHDKNWQNNPNKISRQFKEKSLTSPNEARIYELNIASVTDKRTFEAAKEKIKRLSALGFNAIEIMPVENTFSFNWGYDGVDKFAVSEYLGGPDGLKDLIDYAHSKNINVIIDMVPNHLGPDGAQLKAAGPYIKGANQFGEAFNYEGENSKYVRDFMVNAALNWIENYHCDGLRLDMTKFMESDKEMKLIAAEINYHKPDAFLIAEDARERMATHGDDYWYDFNQLHDMRVTNPLNPEEYGRGEDETVHSQKIEDIENNKTSLARLGFNSEWDFSFFHTLKELLYGSSSLDEYMRVLNDSQTRVKYIMSHDEIGNFDGTRLIPKLIASSLNLNYYVQLSGEDLKRAKDFSVLKKVDIFTAQQTVIAQKAQMISEQLTKMLLEGKLDNYSDENFYKNVLKPLGIREDSNITPSKLKQEYLNAFASNKLAMAAIYSISGPKMVFQGDESSDITPFRFFREFSYDKSEPYLYTEKGYKNGIDALNASTLGKINYCTSAKEKMKQFENLVLDLNILSSANSAIQNGKIDFSKTVIHHKSNVIAYNVKSNTTDDETFVITNFSNLEYPRSDASKYYIEFPKGKWVEILNTDDKKYGGSGLINNNTIINAQNGKIQLPINLAQKSTLIFKKISD